MKSLKTLFIVIVLTSSQLLNGQQSSRFRFTYNMIDTVTVNSTFEMASPKSPEEFKMYISGKASKLK
jgi:hypothetical protein